MTTLLINIQNQMIQNNNKIVQNFVMTLFGINKLQIIKHKVMLKSVCNKQHHVKI